ncbi:hypothetical protein R6Q59_033158 [Mikania micrantha]|uniref:VQ domain-containing protein n=1 Tax=Mikania micrantha TaxID=192012 RepID=A0A5N6NVJ6_9ASTR|nr:hypothetical protein E3N88_17784 [Mikania micrantha]
MTSFNNLATIDPWIFKPTAGDSWYSDAFAGDTELAITKALQQTFFNQSQLNHPISPSFLANQSDYCSTTASTVTGSDSETLGSKRRETKLGVSIGNRKRKSRASKRSVTTFIQADPANFRQMVQEVTGVKLPASTVVKPEPIRQPFVNRLQGLLPTLDTSDYLLQLQGGNRQQIPASNGFSDAPAMSQVAVNGGGVVDLYSLCSYPTLESSINL